MKQAFFCFLTLFCTASPLYCGQAESTLAMVEVNSKGPYYEYPSLPTPRIDHLIVNTHTLTTRVKDWLWGANTTVTHEVTSGTFTLAEPAGQQRMAHALRRALIKKNTTQLTILGKHVIKYEKHVDPALATLTRIAHHRGHILAELVPNLAHKQSVYKKLARNFQQFSCAPTQEDLQDAWTEQEHSQMITFADNAFAFINENREKEIKQAQTSGQSIDHLKKLQAQEQQTTQEMLPIHAFVWLDRDIKQQEDDVLCLKKAIEQIARELELLTLDK